MSKIEGVRFGRRDKQGKIRVIIAKNTELNINGVKTILKDSAVVFVDSHEDASKLLGSNEEKEVETPSETVEE